MSSSMLSLINAALSAQGFDTVFEGEAVPEYALLTRKWPLIVEAELEDGNYHFTRETADLLTRIDGRLGYDDAFLVPSDALHVRKLQAISSGSYFDTDWLQDGTHVHANSTGGVRVEYVTTPGVNLWSANFRLGVQLKLEAVLLRTLEEPAEARDLDNQAEVHFQRARTHSSKARSPSDPYKGGRFVRARFGRYGSA